VVTGILILIPMVALAVVPLYTKHDPTLFGFPFFYWYQILWVFLASVFTYTAHRLIQRARGEKR
jgi:Na+/proline symporter